MHEYSLACEVVKNVMSIAEANQAKEIRAITLGVGKLTHINPEQLLFCLKTLMTDTIAKDADIVLQAIFPNMECECGYYEKGEVIYSATKREAKEKRNILDFLKEPDEFHGIRAFFETPCPKCEKMLHASGGRELIIQSIDIEQ
ncbi:hydrogenase/urease maturation nickel metallochaperone HypA [Methanococcoides sp.]|uniref:hydrogenase/urease maturation nickel metallochaperone HypA n=1 Tax=Methanococcoides sp. TaxID=1966350 RepID=UPI00272E1FFB|nr:hydrogenase/urease maturation nickel metallochaperone HypA [Methanococcoides sp.]